MSRNKSKIRKKELARIRQIIYRAKKKGYTFESLQSQLKDLSTAKLKRLTAKKVRELADYIPLFSDVVLKNIGEMIREAEGLNHEEFTPQARNLELLLNQQIALYGREKVAIALEQKPDEAIKCAERAIYAYHDPKGHREALAEMYMLIKGEIPDVEQSKQFTEWEEENDYVDELI